MKKRNRHTNMKVKALSIALLTGVIALVYSGIESDIEKAEDSVYSKRVETSDDYSAKGALEYWKKIRGSLEDGNIDPQDYNKVMSQIARQSASRNDGIGLEYEPMGPSNIGGRTRSLVIDVDDPNILYAAGVTGGVYKSINGGNTWTTSFSSDTIMTNSWMAQGSDGVLYLATGASPFELAGSSENGGSVPKEPGLGIMKSTDRGETWSLMPSTLVVPTDNKFQHISEIDVSPINPKIIAVASLRGVYVSFDGGATWIDDLLCVPNSTVAFTGDVNSIEFSSDGTRLYAGTDNGSFYYLDDISADNTCGFVLSETANGWVNGSRRMKLSASAINPNKVYAALTDQADVLIDILESSDGGVNFEPVNPNIPRSNPDFDLFGSGQAWYDLLFKAVPKPEDTTRENLWVGGVQLWRFDGNWTQAAVGGRANGRHNPFFVHVDHHIMAYQKDNPSILYFGNDGGVFKSLDGGYEFFDINKGYLTTQFYSIDIANFDYAIGGTQDNGCIIVTPLRPGDSDFGVGVFNENILNGDGFDCVVSNIADVKYTSAQYNNVGRGLIREAKGGGSCGQYCGDEGNFYTKLALWESKNDLTSKTFIEFSADTVAEAIDLGTGIRKTFSGTITPAQDAAQVVMGSLEIGTLDNRLKYNGKGGFIGNGTGTFDESTMEFSVTFDTPPQLNAKVNAYYAANYPAGSVLKLESNTENLPIEHLLTANLEPGDIEYVQDPVQSIIAMAVSSECSDNESMAEGNCSGGQAGIVISRDAINTAEEINWMFVPTGGRRVYRMVFSPDGDKLYASSGNRIVRIDGLNDVYRAAEAEDATNTQILGFQGTITGISIHPNDPETLIVTTGNYGLNADHVYLVTNATSANPTVTAAGGNLPGFPVYDAIFDVTNPERVILGTDKGVWTTNDIWAASPTYVEEIGSFGKYPVIDVDQQTLPHGEATNREIIYFGTHGAGIWKSGTVVTSVEPNFSEIKELKTDIKMFPNPASSNVQVEYSITNPEEVFMQIYSISGNVMKTVTPSAIKGENSINIPINDLPSGTYFINLRDGSEQKTAKFIKM